MPPMKTIALREDVARFAEMMESMMNIKDLEKGPIDDSYSSLNALGELQRQYDQLSHYGAARDKERVKRILVHIANFAMIAEYKLARGK